MGKDPFYNPASKKTDIIITPAFTPVSNWADTSTTENYFPIIFSRKSAAKP